MFTSPRLEFLEQENSKRVLHFFHESCIYPFVSLLLAHLLWLSESLPPVWSGLETLPTWARKDIQSFPVWHYVHLQEDWRLLQTIWLVVR